ncbi:rab3 GTPase-activating protein non-catalytic subunit-like [Amphiura filiformis]|uniref:rab3 GTPase-activating protein non-catalytic subunit-like n=1 Tax=Amphiura filiformis TaxID=82378 RepID=UPI003B20F0C7
MGLHNISVQDSRSRPQTYQCCLMEVSGMVRTIQVPFHLALSNKNSKRARDLHLVKKLSSMLHHKNSLNEPLEDVVVGIISDIKMTSYKQQALDKVLSSKGIPSMVLVKVVTTISHQLKTQGPAGLDYEGQCLLHYCSVQSELLQAYNNLQQLQGKPLAAGQADREEISEDDVATAVGIEVDNLKNWLEQIKVYLDNVCQTKVHFATDHHMDTSAFLGCFQHVVSHDHVESKKKSGEKTKGGEGEERKGELESGDDMKMMLQLKDGLSEDLLLQLGTFLFRPCLQGHCSVEDLCSKLEILGMSSEQLQILLLRMWLANEKDFLKQLFCFRHFYQLMMALSQMATSSNQTKAPDADPMSVWHEVQTLIKNSSKIGAALVAAIFAKCIAMETVTQLAKSRSSQSLKREETTPSRPSSSDQSFDEEPPASPLSMDLGSEPPSSIDLNTDWVSVSMDVEHWDGLIQQLEDLLALSCVIHTKPSQEAFSQLDKAVSKAWTSSQNSSGISESQSNDVSVKRILEGGRELVHSLCRRFPHSMEHDVLQAHCTWEYIVQWNKNPEVTDFFACALQHLDGIRNAVLRHGVASMVWHTFIIKRVSSTAYLMEKVGKAPKDRLCRRDVGLSETALLKFLELTCELLDRIYQTEAETSLAPVFEIEDHWQLIQGPAPLVELAVGQPLPNHQLVDLHKQLSTVMHAVMVFGMKSIKVLGIFDFTTRNAFFRDLHSTIVLPSSADMDMGLLASRQQFLTRVITAAVQTLLPAHTEEEDPQSKHPTSPSTSAPTDLYRLSKTHAANAWPETVIQLAVVFGVDVDLVKRHHVCELYKSGYDSVAQEILVTITEHTEMGSQLLQIAGLRLAQAFIVDTDSVTVEKQSLLPAPVLKWLKTKAGELKSFPLRCPRPPVSDTAQLVGNIVGLLPESHSRYSLAVQLVEAVGSLT